MDLHRTEVYDRVERLAYATKLLSEVQVILEEANYDVAAAYIQMAVDQCGEPQTSAPTTNVADRHT